jgi:hypothetical protein
MEQYKREYLELGQKLNKLPAGDLRGLPWVQRRQELQAIFKAAGILPPTRHEVRV